MDGARFVEDHVTRSLPALERAVAPNHFGDGDDTPTFVKLLELASKGT